MLRADEEPGAGDFRGVARSGALAVEPGQDPADDKPDDEGADDWPDSEREMPGEDRSEGRQIVHAHPFFEAIENIAKRGIGSAIFHAG